MIIDKIVTLFVKILNYYPIKLSFIENNHNKICICQLFFYIIGMLDVADEGTYTLESFKHCQERARREASLAV